MTGYRVARKPVEKSPLSGPDQCRKEIPGYMTSDQSDRFSHPEIYQKMTGSGPQRVTRVRVEQDDIEMSLEFEEGSLQLKQLHKRIDRLSEEAKRQIRSYWKKRMKK